MKPQVQSPAPKGAKHGGRRAGFPAGCLVYLAVQARGTTNRNQTNKPGHSAVKAASLHVVSCHTVLLDGGRSRSFPCLLLISSQLIKVIKVYYLGFAHIVKVKQNLNERKPASRPQRLKSKKVVRAWVKCVMM